MIDPTTVDLTTPSKRPKVWTYDLNVNEMLDEKSKLEGNEIFLIEKKYYDRAIKQLEKCRQQRNEKERYDGGPRDSEYDSELEAIE